MAGLTATHRVSMGNQGVSCPSSSQGSCPPLNPMECGKGKWGKTSRAGGFVPEINRYALQHISVQMLLEGQSGHRPLHQSLRVWGRNLTRDQHLCDTCQRRQL